MVSTLGLGFSWRPSVTSSRVGGSGCWILELRLKGSWFRVLGMWAFGFMIFLQAFAAQRVLSTYIVECRAAFVGISLRIWKWTPYQVDPLTGTLATGFVSKVPS